MVYSPASILLFVLVCLVRSISHILWDWWDLVYIELLLCCGGGYHNGICYTVLRLTRSVLFSPGLGCPRVFFVLVCYEERMDHAGMIHTSITFTLLLLLYVQLYVNRIRSEAPRVVQWVPTLEALLTTRLRLRLRTSAQCSHTN